MVLTVDSLKGKLVGVCVSGGLDSKTVLFHLDLEALSRDVQALRRPSDIPIFLLQSALDSINIKVHYLFARGSGPTGITLG